LEHLWPHPYHENALTPERAEDPVFVHSNLRLLSRKAEDYKSRPSTMWDVGGDAFESLSGVRILEVANLSIDEPSLESLALEDVGDEDGIAVLDVDID
jgi:hypothetical protein